MVVNRLTRLFLPALLAFALAACTALSPTQPAKEDEVARLRQEQQGMAQELQKLREELSRLRGEEVPPAPGAATGQPPVVTESASAAYRDAFLAFAAGHYQDAVAGFEGFLRQYSDSPFRSGARYWLGHSYAGLCAPEQAIAAFEQLASDAPQSSRAPAALLHIASLYQRMNRPDQVREALQRLRTSYPDSAETRRIEAEGLNPAKDPR